MAPRKNINVMMVNITRNQPVSAVVDFNMPKCPPRRIPASAIQKAPYVENAAKPKLLPVSNSFIPAISWVSPPKKSAVHSIGLELHRPRLWNCSSSVVPPKAANPTTAGLACDLSFNRRDRPF